jgi:cysteine desulfurase
MSDARRRKKAGGCGPDCACHEAAPKLPARRVPRKVYLDHAATTPVRPEVVEAMLPFFSGTFGNASSIHAFGREAHEALESARATIARCIGASADEVVLTAGGTESDNLAIRGAACADRGKGRHLITSAIEHPAVLNTFRALESEGFEVTVLPVSRHGVVSVAALEKAIRRDTTLISVMLANNETGVLQPVGRIARLARRRGIRVHTDAVQAVGKVPVDAGELRVDLLTISAHKIGGPKGTGALFVRRGTDIEPIIRGGHQEEGKRPGTENVAGAVGLAKAMGLAADEIGCEPRRIAWLRERLEEGIRERIERSRVNGHRTKRLPNVLSVSFEFVEGESVLLALDGFGIAVSTGSACSSGTLEPSHVLRAMGVKPSLARGSVRLSLGRETTEAQIDYVLDRLEESVAALRRMSPAAPAKRRALRAS